MKRVFTIITAVLISAVSLAQTDAFKVWLKNGKGELAKQKFANKKLDKKEAEEAAIVIDSLWLKEQAQELKHEWKKMILTHDTLQLACAIRTFGMCPRDGRSLYISMHRGTPGTCGTAKDLTSCSKSSSVVAWYLKASTPTRFTSWATQPVETVCGAWLRAWPTNGPQLQ